MQLTWDGQPVISSAARWLQNFEGHQVQGPSTKPPQTMRATINKELTREPML